MRSETEILQWLVAAIAKETQQTAAAIDPDKSVHALGIDSAVVISLTFDLEDRFGAALDPTAIFAHASLRDFARHLAADLAAKDGKA